MQFYRTILQRGTLAPQDYSHHATLADAHTAAKGYDKINDRPHVRVELIDISTDKDGILQLLRGYSIQEGSVADGMATVRILRAWDISDRGGLVEMSADDLRELGTEVYSDGAGQEDVLA